MGTNRKISLIKKENLHYLSHGLEVFSSDCWRICRNLVSTRLIATIEYSPNNKIFVFTGIGKAGWLISNSSLSSLYQGNKFILMTNTLFFTIKLHLYSAIIVVYSRFTASVLDEFSISRWVIIPVYLVGTWHTQAVSHKSDRTNPPFLTA